MVLRSIGKVVRGKATPGQMMAACILGAMLGFVPGVSRAPGLLAALLLALLVVNASLPLALLTWPLAKLASWLLLPVSFQVGRALLDGPTQGLFRGLVNLPVVALFGLEHYAVTGGQLLAVLFGLGLGMLINRAVGSVRRAMAGVEAGSAAYQKLAGRWWVGLLAWALIGGRHGKLTWAELSTRTGGNPLRLWGVGVAAVLVGALFALQATLAGPLLGRSLKGALEGINGATVDVGSATIDLAAGKLVVTGLALADPNALERDAFRAGRLEADIAADDLLRKRVRLDKLVISEASSGLPRSSPGSLVGPEPEPPEVEERAEDERTLEDYVKSAELWRERLRQARRVLDGLSGEGDAEGGGGAEGGGEAGEASETLAERLEREAELLGYANVTAGHLIEGSPTFAITELLAEGVTVEALPGEVLDLRAEHLSTQPWLEGGAPRVTVKARSGKLLLDCGLAAMAGQPGSNALRFELKDFPVDRIAGDLDVGGTPPLQGGTLDVSLDGTWSGGRVGWIDLPLQVALHDTTLQLGGSARKVSEFRLPLGLRGPIDDPAITIDDDQLVASLQAAGAAELSRRVEEKQEELLEDVQQKLDEKAGDKLDEALDGLFKKKKD
ncbi:MAG TPA: hypothetical protein VFD43_11575 [Planctomycetota bacterium]|nr:hypothetical protein [Planctomycetota bacterium]